MIGGFFSISYILLFYFKDLKKITILMFGLMLIYFSSNFIIDNECKKRIIPEYGDYTFYKTESVEKFKKNLKVRSGSLSAGVYFQSLVIAKNTLFKKPLGWGFNRYQFAFRKEINQENDRPDILDNLNSQDASNNFSKIIVEFGYLGFLIFFFVIIYSLNKKIPIEEKIFFVPFIITQTIRGAGYFNGGFAMVFFLMLLRYISINKKKLT